MKKTHVSIVGAGAVGVAVATSILHGRLASRVSLYDLDGDKAHGEALDLGHGAPLLGGPEVDGGSMDSASFGDVCVVTAGAKQRPGEDRLSLLARNERAMSAIAEAFARRGMPRLVVMVTNPVDVMTEAMRRRLEPRGVVVMGSGTLLDTLRLRHALSRRLGISAESIHAHVVGEHGDTAVCLLDSARVGGYPLADVFAGRGLALDEAFRAAIAEEVRGAAYRIIERKGATSHAIGVAVARIVRAVTHDERVVLPVSAPFEPFASAAVPCVIGAQGAEVLPMGALSARERAELDVSLGVLRARCAELGRG